jgi:putative addiction module component (TIGR02574 family)
MTQAADNLLSAVLALDERERAHIAARVLESLESEPNGVDVESEEFKQELLRLSKEAEDDPEGGIPWDEVRRSAAEDDDDASAAR